MHVVTFDVINTSLVADREHNRRNVTTAVCIFPVRSKW